MNGKLIWAIFWALVGVSAVIAIGLFIPAIRELIRGILFVTISGVLLFSLGAALIFLTVKEKVAGRLKKFLILTGASSAGLVVSILLHNAIYGLFIHWFGPDLWERIGLPDEPFFFIIAVFICPVAFLVGAIGSIVLAAKR